MALVRLPSDQWVQVQFKALQAAWSRVRDTPALDGVSFDTFCNSAYKLSSGKVYEYDIVGSQGEDNAVQDCPGGLLHRMFGSS